jgi:hypothetical protein
MEDTPPSRQTFHTPQPGRKATPTTLNHVGLGSVVADGDDGEHPARAGCGELACCRPPGGRVCELRQEAVDRGLAVIDRVLLIVDPTVPEIRTSWCQPWASPLIDPQRPALISVMSYPWLKVAPSVNVRQGGRHATYLLTPDHPDIELPGWAITASTQAEVHGGGEVVAVDACVVAARR